MADTIGPLIEFDSWWRIIFVILWFTFDLPWTTLVSLKERCTRNVGVKDDLLHHMCMVGYEKIYAMLEIVIKIRWLRAFILVVTARVDSHAVIFFIKST